MGLIYAACPLVVLLLATLLGQERRSGTVSIETEQGNVDLGPGELYVVPRGIKHRPVAHGEAHLLLIEPAGTPNTGDPATAATKVHI